VVDIFQKYFKIISSLNFSMIKLLSSKLKLDNEIGHDEYLKST